METRVADSDVDVVMRAARAITAVIAESLAQVGDVVTLPQLRALILVATRRQINPSAVAAELRIHLSNASRMCDRLVQAELLARRESPRDRRQLLLTLTPEGSRLLATILQHRRIAFERILDQLPPARRQALRAALEDFAAAAGEPPEADLLLP